MSSRRIDPAVVSRTMSRVRSKNTKPELALRRELHARNIRYRLHASDLPGTPDLVIRKYRLAVFVDGDKWHGNEHRLRGLKRLEDLYPTNTDFWVAKITANMERDKRVNAKLIADGWHVVRVWASEILANTDAVADRIEAVLGHLKCSK